MHITDQKKHEYWNHFVAVRYESGRMPTGVTGARLRKLKPVMWYDDAFWWDIILRHGGDKCTPEEMRTHDKAQYDHCMGNFWGWITQQLVEQGAIKA